MYDMPRVPPPDVGPRRIESVCKVCPEGYRLHAVEPLPDGRFRLTCETCRGETFVSAEDARKPIEIWIEEIARAIRLGGAGKRAGQHGEIGDGQVVLPHQKRRQP